MSQEYSNDSDVVDKKEDVKKRSYWAILTTPAWVIFCFFIAQLIVIVLDKILSLFGLSTSGLNDAVLNSVAMALVYILTIILVIFVPKLFNALKHYHFNKTSLGLHKLPTWGDILLTPASLVVYFIISALLILLVSKLFPGFNVNQAQEVGFSNLNNKLDYILAFVSLVVIAPFAEELLFRGYLFGKLKAAIPTWLAIIVVSLSFGALHGSWNVAIDTFALSVVLCLLREITGNLWSPILLHMAKNGIAFYFLFINPVLLNTLGR